MAKHLNKACRGCPQTVKDQLKIREPKKRHHKRKRSSSDNSSSTSDTNQSVASGSGLNSDSRSGVQNAIDRRVLQENAQINTGHATGSHSILSGPGFVQALSTEKENGRPREQTVVSSFVDKMSKAEQNRLTEKLAIAVYASGTPLSITSNEFWKDFFADLRPSFAIPSQHTISNDLLTLTFNKIKLRVDEKVMTAGTVGMQCDSWSNIRNEGIINFIVTTPDPVFFKTVETAANQQTAKYIAEKMSEVIESIGSEKMLGVCTDNAASMKSAWAILDKQFEEQKIAFYGCSAHILNLLIKDFMIQGSIDILTKNAIAIVREIKDRHVMSALFNEIQAQDVNKVKTALKLPVKTRFGSLIFCLESLLVNKHNLQALAISPKASAYWKALTKSTILGEEFWIQVVKVVALLKPVGNWITILESDKPRLSQVPEAFFELRKHFIHELEQSDLRLLTATEMSVVYTALSKREDMAMRSIHFAANILDPLLMGKNLSAEQTVKGTTLIFELAKKFELNENKVFEEFTEYSAKMGFWSHEYVQKSVNVTSPENWWKGICQSSVLGKIAVPVLGLPAAATERSFSTYGWIHSAKRNRLSNKRAGMITYIAHNVRLLREKVVMMKLGGKDKNNESESESEEKFTDVEYLDEMLKGEEQVGEREDHETFV